MFSLRAPLLYTITFIVLCITFTSRKLLYFCGVVNRKSDIDHKKLKSLGWIFI